MSVVQSQQERLQVMTEKKNWQEEVENKKRQLEDERRQLQHLKSKALRERWLLDGAPSAGQEEDEVQKQLHEDVVKTHSLEQTILRLEQELEELEMGVSATSKKEHLGEISKEGVVRLTDSLKVTTADSVKAAYSVEITVEMDRLTGETKVLSTSTMLPKDLSHQAVKVYEDDLKVVHAVRGMDSALENGVRPLSSSEVDDLIHKADVADAMSVAEKEGVAETAGVAGEGQASPRGGEGAAVLPVGGEETPRKEITGLEAKPAGGEAPAAVGGATAENPVSMVFMGYQDVEDEAETKKVLGLEGTVKAELVHIEDCGPKEQPAPSNGNAEVKGREVGAGPGAEQVVETQGREAEPNNKDKRQCKCCSIM